MPMARRSFVTLAAATSLFATRSVLGAKLTAR